MKTFIGATFINRRTGQEISSFPFNGGWSPSRVTYNTDMRKFTDSFDFDIEFKRDQVPDIRSHDFVEFWFLQEGQKFQVGVGFVETFVKKTTADGVSFKGNGRNLLGHLIQVPFKAQIPYRTMPLKSLIPIALGGDSYVEAYFKIRGFSDHLYDRGSNQWGMVVKTTALQNRGAILQEYSDLSMNLVYLDRRGRVVMYGRGSRDDLRVPFTLKDEGDLNVELFEVNEDFSKVYSEVSVIVAGSEVLNVETSLMQSHRVKNGDPRVSHLYQPYFKVYSASELATITGQNPDTRMTAIARAEVRKSNQNICQVVITTDAPYYRATTGDKIPYEVGQNWPIFSANHKIDEEMKLASISYLQDPQSTKVQLGFVGKDTLV